MNKEILPLGTIVSLYQNNTKLMIVGYFQKTTKDDKVWDYAAVIYPNGFISPNRMIVFDSVQIERKYLVGYQNLDAIQFLDKIENNIVKKEVEIL